MIKNLLLLLSFLVLFPFSRNIRAQEQKPAYVLVIHGGAGVITKKNMTPEKEKLYTAKLKDALQAGENVLKKGGSALDAVTAAITVMENSPLFNAGKGQYLQPRAPMKWMPRLWTGATGMPGQWPASGTSRTPFLLPGW